MGVLCGHAMCRLVWFWQKCEKLENTQKMWTSSP
jgi:hypothetical protein